jgi:predicted NACHT family NTPase
MKHFHIDCFMFLICLIVGSAPKPALAAQTQTQSTHVQGVLDLAGSNVCSQIFVMHSHGATLASESVQQFSNKSLANDKYHNLVVTELAQLAIAINQAIASGQLAAAKVLRGHLSERYKQASSIGIDLSAYDDLIKQNKIEVNEALSEGERQQDQMRKQTNKKEFHLRPWMVSKTLTGHTGWVRSAIFSPDGLKIVTASEDKTAIIWDSITGKSIATLIGHNDVVRSASFSPDGLRIVTAADVKTAIIWDAITGNSIATLTGHTDRVNAASFSLDGSRIATASGDNTTRIWDAITGISIAALSGHNAVVRSANFSPDGLHIVTASEDKTARIWDAISGKSIATLTGHTGGVNSANFSPDGLRIVTASSDKTVRIWVQFDNENAGQTKMTNLNNPEFGQLR